LSAHTEAGQVLGTPAFMPPEQANGQPDLGPAADVYALGAILYKLLTGQHPYRGDSHGAVLAQVRSGPPPPPQRINAAAPDALAAVCVKAMARRPVDRYASADDLARDVSRWLADEPVSAYREPPSARLARWGRRNRTMVASILAALLIAVAGLSVGLVLLGREQAHTAAERDSKERALLEAEENEQKARTAGRLAEHNERKAVTARRRARRALDRFSSQVVSTLLAQQTHLSPEHRKMLRDVLADYAEFAEAPDTDETARAEVADAHVRMALIRRALGEHAEAARAITRARQLYRLLIADVPGSLRYRIDLANALNNTGVIHHKEARMKEAAEAFQEAVRIERDLPAGARLTDEDESVFHLGRTNLGNLYVETGRFKDAEAVFRAALERCTRRLARRKVPSRQDRSDLAFVLSSLGGLLDHDRPQQAEPLLKRAGDLLRGLLKDFPNHLEFTVRLSAINVKLAMLRARTGRADEAERTFRAVAAEYRKLVERFPATPGHRSELALALHNLGRFLQEVGRLGDAEQPYREALALRQRLVADSPGVPDYQYGLAMSCNNLGNLLCDVGQFAEAVKLLRRGLEHNRKLAVDHPGVPRYRQMEATSTLNLAVNLFFRIGKAAEAEPHFRRGIRLARVLVKDSPTDPERRRLLAVGQLNFSSVLLAGGNHEEAASLLGEARTALGRLVQQYPTNPDYRIDLVKCLVNRLNSLDRARPVEAARAFDEAMEQLQKLLADHPGSPLYRGWLAQVRTIRARQLIERGSLPGAEKLLAEALKERQLLATDFPRVPEHRAQVGLAHSLLADLYERAKQPDKVVRSRQACADIYHRLVADYPVAGHYKLCLAEAHRRLGLFQLQRGRFLESETALRTAVPLMQQLLDDGVAPPDHARQLGNTHVNLAVALLCQKKPAEALKEVNKGLTILRDFAQKNPNDRVVALSLRNAHAERARALDALGRHDDALDDWDQAVKRTPRREQGPFRRARAVSLARAGQTARALAEVEELTGGDNTKPEVYSGGAVVLAVASAAAKDEALREKAARAAVDLLVRARQRGLLKGPAAANLLRKMPELKPLHDRADFKKLLADLEKETEQGPPPESGDVHRAAAHEVRAMNRSPSGSGRLLTCDCPPAGERPDRPRRQ
jgi:tetratricopeptide (TPR) repeat protein